MSAGNSCAARCPSCPLMAIIIPKAEEYSSGISIISPTSPEFKRLCESRRSQRSALERDAEVRRRVATTVCLSWLSQAVGQIT